MPNPLWLDDLLGGLMVVVAFYSAARLVAARFWGRPIHRDIDVAHVLMGTSMAGQLVSDLNPIPSGVWELVFAALAAWFARRCYQFVTNPGSVSRNDGNVHRLARRVIHLMMALAMLYMYLAAVPARIGTGMAMGTPTGTTADFVFIPTVFIVAFLASAVSTLDSIGRFTPAHRQSVRSPAPFPAAVGHSFARQSAPSAEIATSEAPWLAPRLEEVAHIVMVVTMAYMLVLML